MGLMSSVSVAEIKARGSIKDSDVTRLRKAFLEDSTITADDAVGLLSLNDSCPVHDPAWPPCLVELLTDYIVDQVEPFGYLNADKSRWLRERLAPTGKIEGNVKLDLLTSAIARSRWVPQSIAAFALDQVRRAVLDGTGPLRAGRTPEAPYVVAEHDVAALRKILTACEGDGTTALSQAELEVLLAIDRVSAYSDNHPAWRELMVPVLAACMMTGSGYALRSRKGLVNASAGYGCGAELENIMSGMSTGHLAFACEFVPLSREERAIERLTQQKIAIVTREDAPGLDPGWFADYLSQHPNRTPNVVAMLQFMKHEGCRLESRLQHLVEQVASVAA